MIVHLANTGYHKFDIILIDNGSKKAMVVHKDGMGTNYAKYVLAILSRWWLIRKIQVWAIKPAFK